jgi:hypothetical protein
VPFGRNLLALAVPPGQAVGDPQWGERQRDQRRDPIPRLHTEGRIRADLVDDTDEHAAGSRHRVLHLAALADDAEHGPLDRLAVVILSLGQLPVGGGVEIQPLDRDPHLVRPQLRGRVQPGRGLRQHAGGLDHAMQSDGRARCCRHGFSFVSRLGWSRAKYY